MDNINSSKVELDKGRTALNHSLTFIGPNPITTFNKESKVPTIDKSSYLGPFSAIIGDVRIDKNVFIGPNVNIRADEGTPFYIGENTNIQDGVTMHGLMNTTLPIGDEQFSIYIGKNVSCAHGCIIHGPCIIEDKVFIGFNAVILKAVIGKGSYIAHNALVTGEVKIAENKYVPPGAVIDNQMKADALANVSDSQSTFMNDVQHVNNQFPKSYLEAFEK